MSYDATKKRIIDTGNNDGASVHDVQQALGITSNQLKDLCTSGNINKWAKFKPIRVTGVAPLDSRESLDQSYFQNNTAYGIRGLYFPDVSISTFIEQISAVLFEHSPQSDYYPNGYVYLKPGGGTSGPYRLSDFALKENPNVGYSHDAYLMANYQDSNSNWHPLTLFWGMVHGVPQVVERELPADNAVIEDSSNIADSWENYQYNKPLRYLTWPFDANMSVHDIMFALCNDKPTLKSFKHAILFIPEGFQSSPSDCRIVVGSFPEKTITQAQLAWDGTIYRYVEFYTNLSPNNDGFVSTTLSGTYKFLPIPCCYGKVTFIDRGDASGYFIIGSDFAAWNPNLNEYDVQATVQGVNFNHWNAVYLKIGEYEDTGGAGMQINQNISYELGQYVSGNDGDIRYLKLIGVSGTGSTLLYSKQIEIVGGPDN